MNKKAESLKKKIAQQNLYIRELAAREFSTPERRVEVTLSAISRLRDFEKQLRGVQSNDIRAMALAGVLIVVAFSVILLGSFVFLVGSWDIGDLGWHIWRAFTWVAAVVVGFIVVREWFLNSEEEE